MKKSAALCLALLMIFCAGCNNAEKKKTGNSVAQYVLALNPSVMFEDGNIVSIRNSTAASMRTDMSKNTNSALYNSTPWQWVYSDGDGAWNQRVVRNLSIR